MNWLLIVVLAILLFSTWNGYRKGLIKTIFSMISVVAALLITTFFAPIIAAEIPEDSTVYEFIYEKVENTIPIQSNDKQEKDVIESLTLPQSLKDSLIENNNSKIYEMLHIDKAKDSFAVYIYSYLTRLVISAICYIVTFIIVVIILAIVAHALDLISKLPILNTLNKAGGATIGLIYGCLIIWIFFIVITMCSGTDFGKSAYECINTSSILDYIYNHNILADTILDAVKELM